MKYNRDIFLIGSASIAAALFFAWRTYRKEQPEPGENTAGFSGFSDYRNDNSMYGITLPQTDNFKAAEFDSKDGSPVPPIYYGNLQMLMNNLQVLRNAVGLPIFINSGYRSPEHNAAIGGVPSSFHLRALAADIRIIGMSPTQVKNTILDLITVGKMEAGGLKAYPTFTHYDIRGNLTLF